MTVPQAFCAALARRFAVILCLASALLACPVVRAASLAMPVPTPRPGAVAPVADEAEREAQPAEEAPPAPAEPRSLFDAFFGRPAVAASPAQPAEPPATEAATDEPPGRAFSMPLPVPRNPPPALVASADSVASEEAQEEFEDQMTEPGSPPPEAPAGGTMTFPTLPGQPMRLAALPPPTMDWPRFVPGAVPHETLPGLGGERVVADPMAPMACLPPVVKRALTDVALRFGTIIVRSTHRPPDMNRRMGGARASLHIACRAADFRIEAEPALVMAYLRARPELGGVKRYRNGIIHIDDGDKRAW